MVAISRSRNLPPATQVSPTSAPATSQAYTPPNVGLSKSPRLSIVVLPFENLSGDPKDNYLAEGITEDVTTDISRVHGMFVIARESAYTYQGKAIDVRKVGEELGVRYVLEGSVRKFGDTLRVNAQLVATETGAHLWADRFDQKLNDLSAGQEEIVDRIGHTLNVALIDIESARSKRERPTNPDAFDLILRARSLGSSIPWVRRNMRNGGGCLNRPCGWIPTHQRDDRPCRRTGSLAEHRDRGAVEHERAAKLVADAASIRPTTHTYWMLPLICFWTTVATTKQSPRISVSWTSIRMLIMRTIMIGGCLIFLGRFEEAVPMFEMAIRRDPRSAWNYDRYASLGLRIAGAWENTKNRSSGPNAPWPPFGPAIRAYVRDTISASPQPMSDLGDFNEAHRAVAEANRIWPYDTVRGHCSRSPSSRVWMQVVERYQMVLRLAGHRDHAEEDADFGVLADGSLREDYAGLTPTTVPGATTIHTAELKQLLSERKPMVIDPLLYSWGRSIPGAIGLKNAGHGGSTSDALQDRLRRKMQALTKGDLTMPIVAVGWNSERFDGRNLSLRLRRTGLHECLLVSRRARGMGGGGFRRHRWTCRTGNRHPRERDSLLGFALRLFP